MVPDFNIYLVTDRKMTGEALLFGAVERALEAGIRAVQLREKDLPVRELLALAWRMREITARHGAWMFVNDRLDVAMAVGADGVHLARTSMPPAAARKVAGDRFMIGVSTHSEEEVREAVDGGADFVTFGPVFETPSKKRYGSPIGVDELGRIVRMFHIPVFALGGIDESNIPEVKQAGVHGIALISAVLGARDAGRATERIVGLMK